MLLLASEPRQQRLFDCFQLSLNPFIHADVLSLESQNSLRTGVIVWLERPEMRKEEESPFHDRFPIPLPPNTSLFLSVHFSHSFLSPPTQSYATKEERNQDRERRLRGGVGIAILPID